MLCAWMPPFVSDTEPTRTTLGISLKRYLVKGRNFGDARFVLEAVSGGDHVVPVEDRTAANVAGRVATHCGLVRVLPVCCIGTTHDSATESFGSVYRAWAENKYVWGDVKWYHSPSDARASAIIGTMQTFMV